MNRPTAYGFLQFRHYRNPELFHENVAQFTQDMAKGLFIPPQSSSDIVKADLKQPATMCGSQNEGEHNCVSHQQPHQHHQHCGHDEHTSFDQYYPPIDPNAASFNHPYHVNPQVAHHVTPSTMTTNQFQHQPPPCPSQQPYCIQTAVSNTKPLAIPSAEPVPASSLFANHNNNNNNNIIYIGNDNNILHIKCLLVGDQDAGKSHFLSALTDFYGGTGGDQSDNSFLLLNRYVPIIQGDFYNCLVTRNTPVSGDATTDGCGAGESPQASLQQLPQHNHPPPQQHLIDSDIGITQLFLTNDDLLMFLEDLTTPHNEQHHQNNNHNNRVLSYPHFDHITSQLPHYPHICIELIELGGDHLDRLVQAKSRHDINKNNNNDHKINDNNSQICSFSADLQALYNQLHTPRHMAHNAYQSIQPHVDQLLDRTMQLLNPPPNETREEGKQQPTPPLNFTYFCNLETLLLPKAAPPQSPHNQYEVDPAQLLLFLLRVLLLLDATNALDLVSHTKNAEYSPIVYDINILLLRAPIEAYYNQQQQEGNSSDNNQNNHAMFHSAFNSFIKSAPKPDYVLSYQPEPTNHMSNTISDHQQNDTDQCSNNTQPNPYQPHTAIFNRGELELPYEPHIFIQPSTVCQQLCDVVRDVVDTSPLTFLPATIMNAATTFVTTHYHCGDNLPADPINPRIQRVVRLDMFLEQLLKHMLTTLFSNNDTHNQPIYHIQPNVRYAMHTFPTPTRSPTTQNNKGRRLQNDVGGMLSTLSKLLYTHNTSLGMSPLHRF